MIPVFFAVFDSSNRLFASYGYYDKKMFQLECERNGKVGLFTDDHLNIKTLFQQALKLKKAVGMASALSNAGIDT
jgi:inhibitor of KinA sporulation pathway (predicted exonuclease)